MAESIQVDTAPVLRAIAHVEKTLLPVALEEFLRGPAENYLKERASTRFGRNGDDAVGTWAALSPYTVADRLSKGYPGGPANFRSGELHDWIVKSPGTTDINGDGVKMQFPGEGVGADEEKLSTAQQGRSPNPIAGFADVPARPVVGLAEKDRDEVTGLFHVWLEERLNVGFTP